MESNFRLPVTGQPLVMDRRRCGRDCAAPIPPSACRTCRYRRAPCERTVARACRAQIQRDEMRPLTMTAATPLRWHCRRRFGQISVSITSRTATQLDQPQRAAHGKREIERKVEHLVDVLQVAARDLLARHGGGREKIVENWQFQLQIGDQRAHRERFAHGDGVNPDGVVAVKVERDRQVSQALSAVCLPMYFL